MPIKYSGKFRAAVARAAAELREDHQRSLEVMRDRHESEEDQVLEDFMAEAARRAGYEYGQLSERCREALWAEVEDKLL